MKCLFCNTNCAKVYESIFKCVDCKEKYELNKIIFYISPWQFKDLMTLNFKPNIERIEMAFFDNGDQYKYLYNCKTNKINLIYQPYDYGTSTWQMHTNGTFTLLINNSDLKIELDVPLTPQQFIDKIHTMKLLK